MRPLAAAIIAALMLSVAPLAQAGELSVNYLVDARALRNMELLHSVLRFELYADPECRVPIHREKIAALAVQVSLISVSPVDDQAFSRRRAASLQAVLHTAELPAHRYLRVRGPGIRALGPSCQSQLTGVEL